MKNFLTLLGVLMIIFGISTFGYNQFTYTKQEKVAQIGSVQVVADTEKTIFFPPLVSGLCLAAGIVLVVIGRKSSL